ncbi:FAS1-like dehydratase domain-containing protein [Pseudonocardia endophytica]|uniref:MaoC dehydratase-like protein n=1 Tax=Pseudonocardia endophytica TaxID=401976 RepID=A0A4R1HI34_PSEEN|nr:MaoC family dehydratase N-terminal domain-containing protein [Pseudonocardia endophytica]TCK21924.1 MaoC dehydratase-like protein [Pseudonocardia endophytica]
MAVDQDAIGTELPPVQLTVDAGRLRFFAKATGAPVPVEDAPAVPPTFLFSIEFEQPDPFAWLTRIGVDLRHLLHGEQSFAYHSVAHAGDTLVATPRIADVYTKKGGTMEFVVKDTAVTRADGSQVADLRTVAIIRAPEASR